MVPVSTMPALLGRRDVLPYEMVWLTPQNKDAGNVLVIGLWIQMQSVGMEMKDILWTYT